MTACMFALVGPDKSIVGVFAYRSLAEAYLRNKASEELARACALVPLPFDAYFDGYMPQSDEALPKSPA